MKRARGIKALIHDAVDLTLDLVQDGHESVARNAMRVLGEIDAVADTARHVDELRRLGTAGIFGSARGLNRAIEKGTDPALTLLLATVAARESQAPVALRADIMGTRAWAADAALGALNAIVGDHLHARGNGLAIELALRHHDEYLTLEADALRSAFPAPPARVCVFVHGLGATEWSFCLNAAEYHGDAATHFGSLLERDLGVAPVFVRYNSGRHVSENGRLLAERLEAFARAYPGPLDEIILCGHSMGGLVARSACHYGQAGGHAWLGRVRRVMCLGSPHRGAPLEKIGHVVTAILDAIDLPGTRIPARLLKGRSAGIKDLRHGHVIDEEWLGRDPDAFVPVASAPAVLVDGIAYHFVSATVTRDPAHPLGQLVGDLLVRVPSASGPSESAFAIQTFGGVLHHELQNHPDVYRQLLAACDDRTER